MLNEISGYDVSGTIGHVEGTPSKSDFGLGYGTRQRSTGAAGQFLESKGFGWLMEIDDDDEDMQKPLL